MPNNSKTNDETVNLSIKFPIQKLYGHCLTCSNGQGYILNDDGNGYRCGSCDSGYYADYNNSICTLIFDCTNSGGCLKYLGNGEYNCNLGAADYNGYCI